VLTLGTVSDDADSLTIARSVKVFAMREVNEALEHLRKNHARYRAVLVNES
jgi:D-arabinose 1-dehydrogenase-like Zn-dependent alcohol dehydrogenase